MAVKDVLPARISKLRSSLQGRQNVAEQNRAEGASPNTVLWSLAAQRAAYFYRFVKRRTNNTPLSYYVGTFYTINFQPTLYIGYKMLKMYMLMSYTINGFVNFHYKRRLIGQNLLKVSEM